MNNDKQHIISTRTGGLGSSDAKMVAKIGRNGKLSEADDQRIAIMLGLEEKKQFSIKATKFGDWIEECVFNELKNKYPQIISNPYYKSDSLSEKYEFDIFNHIDYEVENSQFIIWIENKATVKNSAETMKEYSDQLKWHQMLLKEKAARINKKPLLFLSHYKVDDYEDFYPENLTVNLCKLSSGNPFKKGFEIISQAIKDFAYQPKEELFAENLPLKVQEQLAAMSSILKGIEESQKKVDDFKNTMKELMQENGVKSIKNEFFNITLVPSSTSTSFDKKGMLDKYPSLNKRVEEFTSKKTKSSYIKLTIK